MRPGVKAIAMLATLVTLNACGNDDAPATGDASVDPPRGRITGTIDYQGSANGNGPDQFLTIEEHPHKRDNR